MEAGELEPGEAGKEDCGEALVWPHRLVWEGYWLEQGDLGLLGGVTQANSNPRLDPQNQISVVLHVARK